MKKLFDEFEKVRILFNNRQFVFNRDNASVVMDHIKVNCKTTDIPEGLKYIDLSSINILDAYKLNFQNTLLFNYCYNKPHVSKMVLGENVSNPDDEHIITPTYTNIHIQNSVLPVYTGKGFLFVWVDDIYIPIGEIKTSQDGDANVDTKILFKLLSEGEDIYIKAECFNDSSEGIFNCMISNNELHDFSWNIYNGDFTYTTYKNIINISDSICQIKTLEVDDDDSTPIDHLYDLLLNTDPAFYDKITKTDFNKIKPFLSSTYKWLVDIVKIYNNTNIDYDSVNLTKIDNKLMALFDGIDMDVFDVYKDNPDDVRLSAIINDNDNIINITDKAYNVIMMSKYWDWFTLKEQSKPDYNNDKAAVIQYKPLTEINTHQMQEYAEYKPNYDKNGYKNVSLNIDNTKIIEDINDGDIINDSDIANKLEIKITNGFSTVLNKLKVIKPNNTVKEYDFILNYNLPLNCITTKVISSNITYKTVDGGDDIKLLQVNVSDANLTKDIYYNAIIFNDVLYKGKTNDLIENDGKVLLQLEFDFDIHISSIKKGDNITLLVVDSNGNDIYPYNSIVDGNRFDITSLTNSYDTKGVLYGIKPLLNYFIKENGNCNFAIICKSSSLLKMGSSSLYDITCNGTYDLTINDNTGTDEKLEYLKCNLTDTTYRIALTEHSKKLISLVDDYINLELSNSENYNYNLTAKAITFEDNVMKFTPYSNIYEDGNNGFDINYNNTHRKSFLDMALYSVKGIDKLTDGYKLKIFNDEMLFNGVNMLLLNEMVGYGYGENVGDSHIVGLKKYSHKSTLGDINSNLSGTVLNNYVANYEHLLRPNFNFNIEFQTLKLNNYYTAADKLISIGDGGYNKLDDVSVADGLHRISLFNRLENSLNAIEDFGDDLKPDYKLTYVSKIWEESKTVPYELKSLKYTSDVNDAFYLFKNFTEIDNNKYNIAGSYILTENDINVDIDENDNMMLKTRISDNFKHGINYYPKYNEINTNTFYTGLILENAKSNSEYYLFHVKQSGMTFSDEGYDSRNLALFQNENVDIEYYSEINKIFDTAGDVIIYRNSKSFDMHNTTCETNDSSYMVKRKFNKQLNGKVIIGNHNHHIRDHAVVRPSDKTYSNNDMSTLLYRYGRATRVDGTNRTLTICDVINKMPEVIYKDGEEVDINVGNNYNLYANNILTRDKLYNSYGIYLNFSDGVNVSAYYRVIIVPCYWDGTKFDEDRVNTPGTAYGYMWGNNNIIPDSKLNDDDSIKPFIKGRVYLQTLSSKYLEINVGNMEITYDNLNISESNLVCDIKDDIWYTNDPDIEDKSIFGKYANFNAYVAIIKSINPYGDMYSVNDKLFGVSEVEDIYLSLRACSKKAIPLYTFTPLEIYNPTKFSSHLKHEKMSVKTHELATLEMFKEDYDKLKYIGGKKLGDVIFEINNTKIFNYIGCNKNDISSSLSNIVEHKNNKLYRSTCLSELTINDIIYCDEYATKQSNYYICFPNFYDYEMVNYLKSIAKSGDDGINIKVYEKVKNDNINDEVPLSGFLTDNAIIDNNILMYKMNEYSGDTMEDGSLYAVINSNTDHERYVNNFSTPIVINNFADAYAFLKTYLKINDIAYSGDKDNTDISLKYEPISKEYIMGSGDFYMSDVYPYGTYYNKVHANQFAFETSNRYIDSVDLSMMFVDKYKVTTRNENGDESVNLLPVDSINTINNYKMITKIGNK